ncbi:ubiquinone biosynthesis accessory factor UbiJ [Nitrincola tapanii]|uniref:Ubiquinone biosynthesis accessory factor UbiJ n=1 Tax=Nitrincola tapanii TaxID=1708751 RepID=A0A5A9W7H0_9GAMM|nr:SCP2 sterol-binding domain-containing protein [Nitrincola tapanii]KAA0876404.1 hypothetical protein E1H14_01380 [Nitrincola tapanii]
MPKAMLQAAWISSAELSLNAILQLDPVSLERLKALSGQVIRLEMTEPSFHLCLLPHAQGLDLLQHCEARPDLTLRGSASAFLQMAQSPDMQSQMFGKGISLEGDLGLANQLKQLISGFQIDWEEWLANILGDTLAHPLAQGLRQSAAQGQRMASSLTASLLEYLQEEVRLLPPHPEVDAFLDEVEQVRDDVERLEARIQRLRQKGLNTTR